MDASIFSQKEAFDYASQFEQKLTAAGNLQTALTGNVAELSGMITEVERGLAAGETKFNAATLSEMQQRYADAVVSAKAAVNAL